MAALSYPTRILGLGTGWGQGMVCAGSTCGFYFFPLLVAALGLRDMLLALAAVPLIGLIAAMSITWEPTMQDVEDVHDAEVAVMEAGPASASV